MESQDECIRKALHILNYYIDHAVGPFAYQIQPEDLMHVGRALLGSSQNNNEEN